MPYGYHSHSFAGKTSYNNGHIHGYLGKTSLNRNFSRHTHTISGRTTFRDGHIHSYFLQSGRPIKVRGGHIHYYRAATTYNKRHRHYMSGYTSR
ncbi:MAG: hypothetical protein GX254_11475 [Clostridiales bacterium]|jgi:hypothetical protein|nr:hypothetical protein [Clostridiales bacterium]